ncbi:hypothetical protein [Leifsonia sp. EB34]|uniref:hypothetical protein n=1 Tax=Leifsonia sp. EB34 TaxID=3156303 RepID=UPI003511876C
MKNIDKTSSMVTTMVVGCCLVLSGCSVEAAPRHSGTASRSAIPNAGVAGTGAPSADPSSTAPVEDGTRPEGDPTAQIRTACTLFAASFDQEVKEKFLSRRKAVELAQVAARQDNRWEAIAEDMERIREVGERVNGPSGEQVSVEEGDAANRAVTDVRAFCIAAGAEFTLPAD